MAELRVDTDTGALPAAWAAAQGGGERPDAMDEEKAPSPHRVDGQVPTAATPRSLRQQYPLNMTVDFTKLRANALRRYMAFHGIQEIPGSCRDQLAIVVAQHFSEQCKLADEETSIASFLTYIKGGRVLPGTSESDSGNDSSEDSERGGRFDRDEHRVQRATFSTDGAHEIADTESNSSTSSSNDGNDEDNDDPMGDAPPVKNVKRSRPSSSSSKKDRSKSKPSGSSSSSSASNHNKNKKQRKTRLYCVCKGASFGNMIACDNKKCSDRSNWYHMACVDLDPSKDPPETWYCPSCQEMEAEDVPENQYRKPVASVTYGDMISHALTALPEGKGSFKEICDFVEKQYESQLNWKLESDQRKSPVWKSSVRKILFSNMRFRKHPDDKGLFCLAA